MSGPAIEKDLYTAYGIDVDFLMHISHILHQSFLISTSPALAPPSYLLERYTVYKTAASDMVRSSFLQCDYTALENIIEFSINPSSMNIKCVLFTFFSSRGYCHGLLKQEKLFQTVIELILSFWHCNFATLYIQRKNIYNRNLQRIWPSLCPCQRNETEDIDKTSGIWGSMQTSLVAMHSSLG